MSLNTSGQSTSLRSRKVDVKKSLAILVFDQQNDLEIEAVTSLPAQVSTGVEKGEEEVRFEDEWRIETPNATLLKNQI